MVFPVISKFNAELEKQSLSYSARDNVKYKLLSTPGQVIPRQTHLTFYACPIYQLVSLAY